MRSLNAFNLDIAKQTGSASSPALLIDKDIPSGCDSTVNDSVVSRESDLDGLGGLEALFAVGVRDKLFFQASDSQNGRLGRVDDCAKGIQYGLFMHEHR